MHDTRSNAAGSSREGRAKKWMWNGTLGTRAFTLIELLVVIAIIAILAGLSLRFIGGAQETAKRKKATAQLDAIKLGLENFQIDNGEYPINDGAPEDGAPILYQALSGDGNDLLGFFGASTSSTGRLGSAGEVYWKDMSSQGIVGSDSTTDYALIDPWANAYRYVRKGTAAERRSAQKNEATYDLWTLGGGEESEEDEEKWIKNW
ncbi:MAG: prepilin-type N-terminal cleavage/methylation domain-containing protein [Verrucomicrobiota bacterium]